MRDDSATEVVVVAQDAMLEVAELRSRFHPQLLDEQATRRGVDRERVGLPACPVQRHHELPAEALVERMVGDELLELGDQLGVAPESDVGCDAIGQDSRAQAIEPDRSLRERTVHGRVGEARRTPGIENHAQHVASVAEVAVRVRCGPLSHSASRRTASTATGSIASM